MDAVHIGGPAVIMAFQWDWSNIVFTVLVVALLIGAFYFRSTEAGNGGAVDEGRKGPPSKKG